MPQEATLDESWWRVEVESRSALIAAMQERIARLERYVREGDAATYCEETQAPPGNHSCGGCDGCLLAQAIHAIRQK